MTYFEQLGGEAPLRAILRDFYDRVFDDVMIGYLFRDQDKGRLNELEYQFAARHLGAKVVYTGRTMKRAHAGHSISKGHFMRRNKLLELTLRDHQVPEAVFEKWMGFANALGPAVIGAADVCGPSTGAGA